MVVIAVDYGDVRTGISISDVTGTLAGRSITLTEKGKHPLADEICRIFRQENGQALVLGLPLNMDGSEGERADKTRRFGALLEKRLGQPVIYWDERCSSVTAGHILSDAGKKRKKQRAVIDAVAAAIILQSYLDAQSE